MYGEVKISIIMIFLHMGHFQKNVHSHGMDIFFLDLAFLSSY